MVNPTLASLAAELAELRVVTRAEILGLRAELAEARLHVARELHAVGRQPLLSPEILAIADRLVAVIEKRHERPPIVTADAAIVPNDLDRWVMLESSEFAQDERRQIVMQLFDRLHRWDQVRIRLSTDPDLAEYGFRKDMTMLGVELEPVHDANHDPATEL